MVAALVLALAGPAQAQHDPASAWQPVDAETGRITGITDLQALRVMFPDSASVRRRLLNAYLEAERPADALAEAVELARRGYVFSPRAQELLLTLGPTDEQRAALAHQAPNAVPIEASRPLAEVPAEAQLVESAWHDPGTGSLFVASVVSRSLYVARSLGAWTTVSLPGGAGSLSGLAFDPTSGLLWAASGVFDQTPEPATAFRGLIGVDPATGSERRRLLAPAGATPSDLAVLQGGTILASDPMSGAIYAATPGDAGLRELVTPGIFRSPQGLIPWGDEGLLVSDYAYGLALVDADARAWRVQADGPFLLDGIDGMWRRGDTIIAVQNGARPPRIVELTMSADGRTVKGLRVLERAHPAWTEPVGGSVVGDELVYVATGQWDRFGDGGSLAGERPPVPTEIRVLPLGSH